MNEHKDETTETFDITPLMILIFFIIIYLICHIKHVKVSRIRFEYKQFERETIKGWSEMMYKEFPYNHNSKMAISTDVSSAKIRYICNN